MNQKTIGVAQAKKTFSDLLGQVAYGEKRVVLTKRGKPMALLSPPVSAEPVPFQAGGWLAESDPFFENIDLDTNILSELVKKRPNPYLLSRISSQPAQKLYTSIICIMELRYGSALRDDFKIFW